MERRGKEKGLGRHKSTRRNECIRGKKRCEIEGERQLREEERGGNEYLIGSCCLTSKGAEQGLAVFDTG